MSRAGRIGGGICAAAAGLILCGAAAPFPAHAADNSACTACHGDQGAKLVKSAHAELACASCHIKHEEYPHPADIPKPACSQCHKGESVDYERGVHGPAV